MEIQARAAGAFERAGTGCPECRARLDAEQAHFWKSVDKSGGANACWPWTGARSENGYGIFITFLGGKKQRVRAHRYALATVKALAIDQMACHRCDNPICCNPAHLFAGSATDNGRDMMQKGRGRSQFPARRDGHPSAKLSAAQAAEIRTLYATGQASQKDLGLRFGVNNSTINRLIHGRPGRTS